MASESVLSRYASMVVRSRWRPSGPMLGLLAILLLFVLLLAYRGELGNFLRFSNVQAVFHLSSIRAVVALGMLLIIISGGIDLSVGSVVALVAVVTVQAYRMTYNSSHSALNATLVAVPLGVLVGGLCGLCNGLAVTRLRVTPFVATLGMMSIARGLAYWLAGRTSISLPVTPKWVDAIARANAGYALFDLGVWSLVVLAVVVAVLLNATVFGRYCYAIGSNENTARLCGVRVDRHKILIYTLAGLLTGWAGVMQFAHGNGANPSAARGFELDVIAAVVIGGGSLAGGQGTVQGALLGVLILAVLENGVSYFSVPVEIRYILMGVIVLANTALSQWQKKRE